MKYWKPLCEATPTDPKNVQEALLETEKHAFDLIFMDVNMPDMNGFDVCAEIRKSKHNKNTPVIFVTMHSDYENRFQSLQSGGDDLISKPITPLELIVKSTVFLLSIARPPIPDTPPRFRKAPKTPAVTPQAGNAGKEGAKGQDDCTRAARIPRTPEKPTVNDR